MNSDAAVGVAPPGEIGDGRGRAISTRATVRRRPLQVVEDLRLEDRDVEAGTPAAGRPCQRRTSCPRRTARTIRLRAGGAGHRRTPKAGREQVQDVGGVNGPDDPAVERREAQSVHRVDDAEHAGVRGLAAPAPHRERRRDPVVAVGDVVVPPGQLVGQARRSAAPAGTRHTVCRRPPGRRSRGTGGVLQVSSSVSAYAGPASVQQRHQGRRGVGRRVVSHQRLDPLGPGRPRARAPARRRRRAARRRRPLRCRTTSPRSCR